MNIQQLQYLLAVNKHRHFARAAESCCVTQPTLSMMIQKLEDEYGIQIFDRSKQPVVPTESGKVLIEQAKMILNEIEKFGQIVNEQKNILEGTLKVGIIPTVAPYLLPLFVESFCRTYPHIALKINELLTPDLLKKLHDGDIDVGILVAPEDNDSFEEQALYYEPMVLYSTKIYPNEYILAEDINAQELLLLEEGHCFRSQILKLCELRKISNPKVEYSSGSLETLKNLADKHLGVTILPEMATLLFSEEQLKKIKHFVHPQPLRKVSVVTHRNFAKKRLIACLFEQIIGHIPEKYKNESGQLIPL
jgi:LysR family transcriptional regulator, hydrogen peroxide-inducible genes activator